MALASSCLISVTGDSGSVLISYLVGATYHRIQTDAGTMFLIDGSASDVTYTTLSGNAIAESECLYITPTPLTHYKFEWEMVDEAPPHGQSFQSLLLNDEEILITPVDYPFSKFGITNAINNLNDNRAIVTAQKSTSKPNGTDYGCIIKVLGEYKPILKIKNQAGTHFIYLIGQESEPLPSGYTEVNDCQITFVPAPTTIFLP